MLQIRQAQIDVLADGLVARFEHELAFRVAARCQASVEALGPAATRALIQLCVRSCLTHGFGDRHSITRAADRLFGQPSRLLASGDAALAAVLRELEAERLRSLLETAADLAAR